MAANDSFSIGQAVKFRTSGPLGHSEERYGIVQDWSTSSKGTYYTIKEDGEPTAKVVKARPALMTAR